MSVAPKMLPAGSTQVSSPAAPISDSSHARASSWGGDQHMRVTPPPGKAPKRARLLMREVRRGSENEITVNGSISLDFNGEGFENEPPFSCPAGPPSGGEMDLSLTPEQEAFRASVRSWL